jgi:hypothetical protein
MTEPASSIGEPVDNRATVRRWPAKVVTTLGAWLVAFLLVTALLSFFGDELASLPLALRALVISGVLMTVMTTVVMPALSAAVGRWHAGRPRTRSDREPTGPTTRRLPSSRTETLSHEQVRRIAQGDSVAPYFVTVERQGVSPLRVQVLVRAPSKRAAGELASWIAERKRDGIFEATKIRRAARKVSALPASSFDDADL